MMGISASGSDPDLTPLVGRDDELARVLKIIGDGHRVVTITGPGGIGKTRVAHAVAAAIGAEGTPVSVVDLHGLDPQGSADTVLEAGLALGTGPGSPVLVIDTAEGLLGATEPLTSILRSTTISLVLASRTRLRIDGEQVIKVGPLPNGASEALFSRQADSAGVDPSDISSPTVARICDAVGHHPLAIELAAARVAAVGLEVVVGQLTSGVPGDFLAALEPAGSALPQLSVTIDRSTAMLTEPAARLLRSLSIVPGPFGTDLVDELCKTTNAGSRSSPGLLAELAELHLVERLAARSAEGQRAHRTELPALEIPDRFRVHRVVAEHSRGQLERRGGTDEARAAYLDHARRLAKSIGAGVRGDDEAHWQRAGHRERSTLHGLLTTLADDPTLGPPGDGLEVAVALAPHWLQAGPIDQGRRWLGLFLGQAASDDTDPLLVAEARAWAAVLAVEVGEHDHLDAHERAVTALRGQADPATLLVHLDLLTQSRLLTGNFPGATDLAAECHALAIDHGSAVGLAKTLNRRANIARQEGRTRDAAELALQLLERAEDHDRPAWQAWAHAVLSDLAARARSTDAAEALRDSHDRSLAAGLLRPAMWTSVSTGGTLSLRGDVQGSCDAFVEGLRLATAIGHRSAAVCAAAGIGGLASFAGLHRVVAPLHRGLAHHLAPLETGVMPPMLRSAYHANRDRTYAALGHPITADSSPFAPPELRPWSEVALLAVEVADELGALSTSDRGPTENGGAAAPPNSVLSAREREVLTALAEGGTNREIAVRLFISPKTVMHHTSAIYRKLQVNGRAEAVARAYQDGILTSD